MSVAASSPVMIKKWICSAWNLSQGTEVICEGMQQGTGFIWHCGEESVSNLSLWLKHQQEFWSRDLAVSQFQLTSGKRQKSTRALWPSMKRMLSVLEFSLFLKLCSRVGGLRRLVLTVGKGKKDKEKIFKK